MTDDDAIRQEIQAASTTILAALRRMRPEGAWATSSEIEGISAASFTAMAKREPAWVERRHVRWGGEPGQKHGRGYEYRLTPHGEAVRRLAAG